MHNLARLWRAVSDVALSIRQTKQQQRSTTHSSSTERETSGALEIQFTALDPSGHSISGIENKQTQQRNTQGKQKSRR